MATVKREQVKKINSGCKNGFELDVYRLLMWGEKQLVKEIPLENGNILKAALDFDNIYENYKKVGLKPVCRFSILYKTSVDSMYRVQEISKDYMGELIQRRSMKQLQELTALDIFTDAAILANYAK